MRVYEVRPAARQLRYQLYSRPLHPELFDVRASTTIEMAGYLLRLRLCEAGHLVELRRAGETVLEVNVDEGREVPHRGRCLSVTLGNSRDLEAQPIPDVSFQASVQLETLDPEVFDRLTQEYQFDRKHAALSHVFGSRNRLRPDALSVVFADCGPKSVGIHAYHTFPDDLAVVRTQSLYQFTP